MIFHIDKKITLAKSDTTLRVARKSENPDVQSSLLWRHIDWLFS